MFLKLVIIGLLASVHSINSASAPFITKCKKADSKCMKSSAQVAIPIFAKGIPELGVETLDPFFMKSLDASSKDLKLVLSNITGTGLSQCIAKKIIIEDAKSELHVKLQCSVDFEGQYIMNGRLLILPIEGNGRAHVVLNNVVISAIANLVKVTGKDEQTHWSIKSFSHTYVLKDKAIIELENLFGGNKDLGRAATNVLKESPNEIIAEAGPPIIEAVVGKIVVNVNHLFKYVPVSELIQQN